MRKIICKQPGCFRTIDPDTGHKYCPEHQAQERAELERRKVFYQNARHGLWSELYGSIEWKSLRDLKLRETPYCEICGAPATEVHHIKPHNGDLDLFMDYNNLASLCHSCHAKETQKESEVRRRQNSEERQKEKLIRKRKLWY